MMSVSSTHPLTSTEFDQLGDLLALSSRFDTDGVLGVLNAVVVAPSVVPPSTWLELVMSGPPGDQPTVA